MKSAIPPEREINDGREPIGDDAAVLAVTILAVLVEPSAYLAVAFCVWVLVVGRRRAGQKYEGLRILR